MSVYIQSTELFKYWETLGEKNTRFIREDRTFNSTSTHLF